MANFDVDLLFHAWAATRSYDAATLGRRVEMLGNVQVALRAPLTPVPNRLWPQVEHLWPMLKPTMPE